MQRDPANTILMITVVDLDSTDVHATIIGKVVRSVSENRDIEVFYLEDTAGSDDSVLKITVDAADGHRTAARE